MKLRYVLGFGVVLWTALLWMMMGCAKRPVMPCVSDEPVIVDDAAHGRPFVVSGAATPTQ